jgi:hypothetical protein
LESKVDIQTTPYLFLFSLSLKRNTLGGIAFTESVVIFLKMYSVYQIVHVYITTHYLFYRVKSSSQQQEKVDLLRSWSISLVDPDCLVKNAEIKANEINNSFINYQL